MPAGQAEEIIALALVFVVHVVGGLLLVWALLDDDQRAGWRRRWGWGGGEDPRPPQPPADPARDERPPLPLAHGDPGPRAPARADPRRGRATRVRRGRPAHPEPPAPQPAPSPERRRRA